MPCSSRLVLLSAVTAFALGSIAATAFAEKTARVELRSDQDAGVFKILIDGSPVLTVSDKTVRVRGDIEYTGMLTDGTNSGVADAP